MLTFHPPMEHRAPPHNRPFFARFRTWITSAIEEEKTIYGLVLRSMLRAHAARTANALAFDFFLALIPMLGLAGWFASNYVAPLLPDVDTNVSVFAGTPREIRRFLESNMSALSGAELAPLAALSGLWLSSSAFNTFFAIVMTKELPAWRVRLLSLGYAALGSLVLVTGSTIGVVLTLDSIGLLSHLLPALSSGSFLRWFVVLSGFLALTAFVAALYRSALGSVAVWRGAAAAIATGSLSSLALAYYTSKLGNYALYYGGLAAAVGLMVWLWSWCWALLLGAYIAEALTTHSSTQGATSEAPALGTQTPRSDENPAGD